MSDIEIIPSLLTESGDPATYGSLISNQLFADTRLRDDWLKASASAANEDLQLRLNLDAGHLALHALRWECLRDPEDDQPTPSTSARDSCAS